MGITLVWEEPPASTGNRGRGSEIDRTVDALKRNPGKWARVETAAKTTSAAIKWRRRGCEAVARRPDSTKNNVDVYARWPETDPKVAPAKAAAKKATPQELAAAYAQKHGAGLAPGREKLTAPAGEEPDVTRTGEDTPPAITQAWKNRLGHGKGNR